MKQKIEVNWLLPWIVGLMFTIGYLLSFPALVDGFNAMGEWQQIAVCLFVVFTWPMFLGLGIGGIWG